MIKVRWAHAVLALLLPALAVPMLPAPAANAASCTDPKFVTSDPNGMWSTKGYVVHNNMWNASGYNVSETLKACSHRKWFVRAKANNSSGDGAVKTYPNVHKDFHNWSTGHEPRIGVFKTIKSRFAARAPGTGIYNVAYDIWLDGVPGDTEVMIWTDNHKQVPAGRVVARGLKFNDRTWRVFATADRSYIAFVPGRPKHHGTMNIKARLSWLKKHSLISRRATLGQICFGVEIVSTNGQARRFKFNDFSVKAVRR